MAGITSTKKIKGQPHLLAYITPNEVEKLKALGGQETMTAEGIPAYPERDNYGFSSDADFNSGDVSKSNDPNVRGEGVNFDGSKQNRVSAVQLAAINKREREDAIREEIKKRELEKLDYVKPNPFKSVFDFGKNYITNRKKGLYNLVPNNPKRELEFLSSLQITDPARYDRLPQNLKDVLEATQHDFSGKFKDQPKFSYDNFKSLTKFDDGAFAQYAKDRGSPGLSVSGDMSKIGMKSVRRDPITKEPIKDIFGNTLFDYADPTPGGGGGGSQNNLNYLPLNYGLGVEPVEQEKETQTFEFDPLRFGPGGEAADVTRASYIFNQGGRVPRAFGGIMNAVPRKGFFLGGIGRAIGKVAKAAGKVLSSDVGKAALAAGAFYYGGGGTFAPGGSSTFSPGTFFSRKNPLLFSSKIVDGVSKQVFNPLKFAGLTTAIGAMAGPAKVDQLPGDGNRGGRLIDPLTGKEATPAEMRANIDSAVEEAAGDPVKLAAIDQKYNNMLNLGLPDNLPYPNYALFASGGRVPAQEGGLMNLGGMEKDYRAEGGFVPIGKAEKADDVPARLSVNEFVFTADAVRNAGGGDIDRGAEVMENMMKNLENGGRVSEESQGNAGAQEMFSVSERIGEVI